MDIYEFREQVGTTQPKYNIISNKIYQSNAITKFIECYLTFH